MCQNAMALSLFWCSAQHNKYYYQAKHEVSGIVKSVLSLRLRWWSPTFLQCIVISLNFSMVLEQFRTTFFILKFIILFTLVMFWYRSIDLDLESDGRGKKSDRPMQALSGRIHIIRSTSGSRTSAQTLFSWLRTTLIVLFFFYSSPP